MHVKQLCCLTAFTLFIGSCSKEKQPAFSDWILTAIETPCQSGGQQNLFSSGDNLYMSWVEYLNDTTDALMYAQMDGEKWGNAVEIARGSDWFVNWADFPSIAAYGNSGMAAHWLQKRTDGTYDYDVHISQSTDAGASWNRSFIPHRDSIAAEHGFVSMVPIGPDRMFATWLDGRHMPAEEGLADDHDHGHGGGGPMTIRCAEFDRDGNLSAEHELDDRVCECCQTDAAVAAAGPVVVYRDRSEDEIRDIYIVRRVDDVWSSPKSIHADQWDIAACPVNGPAVTADGDNVAVAWFTAPDGVAQVNVVFSTDGGASFGAPVRVDGGKPIGRVDIAWIGSGQVIISWIENVDQQGEIRASILEVDGRLVDTKMLMHTSTSRRSGFPILARTSENVFMAWTDLSDDQAKVRTMKVLDISSD